MDIFYYYTVYIIQYIQYSADFYRIEGFEQLEQACTVIVLHPRNFILVYDHLHGVLQYLCNVCLRMRKNTLAVICKNLNCDAASQFTHCGKLYMENRL